MSKKIYKCIKCQNNAETQPRWDEFTETYPIRDKDGKIYCWDCYKNKSHCEGCQKSVSNLKFPKSGNPYYPHVSGYGRGCERVWNEVKFICSKKCAKDIAAKKYQAWKEKLSQGWIKCEECVKFWIDGESNNKGWEWLKEEKHQWKVIKLAAPGQGKWCPDHKNWEEGGKQRYEAKNIEYQKRWEILTEEEKLSEVKKAYRRDKNINITEFVTRSEIPPMVLYEWQEKDNHRNCPDCQLDNEPADNDNNLTGSTNKNENDSESNQPSKNEDKPKNSSNQNNNQTEKNALKNSSSGLIIGTIVVVILGSFITIYLLKKRKK